MGLEQWGHLDDAIKHDGQMLGGATPRLRAIGALLTELGNFWRHGRGRPLDREALVEGGVTLNFIERVWEIACREGRDAARVLAAIDRGEVPRFREAACERLREFCQGNGCLAREKPLEAVAIRARLQDRGRALGVEPARIDSLLAKIYRNETDAVERSR